MDGKVLYVAHLFNKVHARENRCFFIIWYIHGTGTEKSDRIAFPVWRTTSENLRIGFTQLPENHKPEIIYVTNRTNVHVEIKHIVRQTF